MLNAVWFYRIERWLFLHRVPFLPRIIQLLIFLIYNSRIPPSASIGKNTSFICGGIGVLLHRKTVIGDNCNIGVHVCIAGKTPYRPVAIIKDNVFLGHNAVILGPVIIEKNAIIAAGAVVTKSVPQNAIVAGAPAKIIGWTNELDYTLLSTEQLKEEYMPYLENNMWSKIKRLKQSKLLSNIANLFLLQGFSYIFPILLIPFLTKTIGVERYGLIYFSISVAFYFQIVSEFGFDLSNVKHVVANRNDVKKLSEIVSTILSAKLLLALLLFIIYIGIIRIVPRFNKEFPLYLIAYGRVIGTALTPYWLFRSMENIKHITQISVRVKCLLLTPIFFLVKDSEDYLWVIFFYTLVEIVSGIIALRVAIKSYQLKLQRPSIGQLKFYFKDSLPFFTSTLMTRLYTRSNLLVVGIVLGDFMAGIYSISEKLYKPYAAIVAPLIQHVFYPYFMRIKNFALINRMVISAAFTNVLLVLLVWLISPLILPLMVKESWEIVYPNFCLFLILLVIDVPAMFLGYPYLGAMGKIQYVNNSAIHASLFHISGILLLIGTGNFTITTAIICLIFTQSICLLERLWHIHRFRNILT